MKKEMLYLMASVLILIGLALIVIGLGGTAVVWQIGLILVALAMLVSLISRWSGTGEGE
jgi:hypothetical protein